MMRLSAAVSRSSSRRFSSRSALPSPVSCASRPSRSAIWARRAAISMAISARVASAVRSRFCVLASSWRRSPHSLCEAASFFSKSESFVAQLAVGGAGIVEHRLQRDLLGFLGLHRAQRLAHRVGQPADRVLDGVELADLGVGVEQQIAQRLVLAADLGADRREQFLVEFERIIGGRGAGRRRRQRGCRAAAALRAKTPPNLLMAVILLAPIRPAESDAESRENHS